MLVDPAGDKSLGELLPVPAVIRLQPLAQQDEADQRQQAGKEFVHLGSFHRLRHRSSFLCCKVDSNRSRHVEQLDEVGLQVSGLETS